MKLASSKSIALILLLVSLLTPQGAYYFPNIHQDFSLFGFLWTLSFSTVEGFRFHLTLFSGLVFAFPLFILGLPFIYQVVRYCQGFTGKMNTIALGIVLTCPILFFTILFMLTGIPFNFYPVPILLFAGLVIMLYAGPKSPTTPWDDLEIEQ